MSNVSVFYVKVCLPLLSNKENHQLWPNVISQDATQHIENLSNKVYVVKGQVHGKTVLPVPAVTERIEDCPEASISLYDEVFEYIMLVYVILIHIQYISYTFLSS